MYKLLQIGEADMTARLLLQILDQIQATTGLSLSHPLLALSRPPLSGLLLLLVLEVPAPRRACLGMANCLLGDQLVLDSEVPEALME